MLNSAHLCAAQTYSTLWKENSATGFPGTSLGRVYTLRLCPCSSGWGSTPTCLFSSLSLTFLRVPVKYSWNPTPPKKKTNYLYENGSVFKIQSTALALQISFCIRHIVWESKICAILGFVDYAAPTFHIAKRTYGDLCIIQHWPVPSVEHVADCGISSTKLHQTQHRMESRMER